MSDAKLPTYAPLSADDIRNDDATAAEARRRFVEMMDEVAIHLQTSSNEKANKLYKKKRAWNKGSRDKDTDNARWYDVAHDRYVWLMDGVRGEEFEVQSIVQRYGLPDETFAEMTQYFRTQFDAFKAAGHLYAQGKKTDANAHFDVTSIDSTMLRGMLYFGCDTAEEFNLTPWWQGRASKSLIRECKTASNFVKELERTRLSANKNCSVWQAVERGDVSYRAAVVNAQYIQDVFDNKDLMGNDVHDLVAPLMGPPLQFDPNKKVNRKDERYDYVSPAPVHEAFIRDAAGAPFVSALFDGGMELTATNKDALFVKLFENVTNDEIGALDKWAERFPTSIHALDATSCNAVVNAIRKCSARQLKWALSKGIEPSQNNFSPLSTALSEQNQSIEVLRITFEMSGAYLKLTPARLLVIDGDTTLPLEDRVATKETLIQFCQDVRDQIRSIQNGTGRSFDKLSSDDLQRFYTAGQLQDLLSSNVWKGHEEQLMNMAIVLPAPVAKVIEDCTKISSVIKEQSGTPVSGPFDAQPLQPPKTRDRGDS